MNQGKESIAVMPLATQNPVTLTSAGWLRLRFLFPVKEGTINLRILTLEKNLGLSTSEFWKNIFDFYSGFVY